MFKLYQYFCVISSIAEKLREFTFFLWYELLFSSSVSEIYEEVFCFVHFFVFSSNPSGVCFGEYYKMYIFFSKLFFSLFIFYKNSSQ